jgi:adenosine deaminase
VSYWQEIQTFFVSGLSGSGVQDIDNPQGKRMLRTNVKEILIAILFICFTTLAGCDFSSDSHGNDNSLFTAIDKKLENQFVLYDQAREKIIQRVVDENGVVEREEWDTWLTPAPGDLLDEWELAQISERQQQTIEDSRLAAMAAVTLDLDLIRNDNAKLAQYCTEFPKGALLHIHPTGTRNRQTVEEILEAVNPVINGREIVAEANDGELSMLYPDEIEFLSALPVRNYLDYDGEDQNRILGFFFLPDTPPTHEFKRFEAVFTINDLFKQDPSLQEWVEEKTYVDFLNRCAAQNVSYVEFTRVMWPDPATFEKLHTWAEKWYGETGITVRWNSAFIRTLDADSNDVWTREFISVVGNRSYPALVGIDLLANETHTPALETGQKIYIPILAANQQGEINIHRTMHAGELGRVHNVRDAMILGAERVGHGVLLARDPLALEYAVQEKNLPIEINLYSNYRLQVNEDFSSHPFLDFLRLGLPVSLSTDDEGIFVTDIANEYKIAISHTDITHEELKQMAYNSIETAFADEAVKTKLLKKLDADFASFETRWAGEL